MRAALALLAAVPSLALAEPATPEPAAAEAAKLEAQVGALPGTEVAEAPASAGSTHTVVRGDTLWDLSAKALRDPYAWPKIWSWNPEIANPHWIYPGNVIRLGPAGASAADATAAAAAPADDSDLAAPPQELADFTRAEMTRPQEIGEGDEVAVAAQRRIGMAPRKGTFPGRESFVTRRELEESGVVAAAFEDKLLLTTGDRAYVRFAQAAPVKVGESYALFRTERIVNHPVSGRPYGYMTSVIGSVRVVAVDEKAATVAIASASDVIERGCYVAPLPSKSARAIARRANEKQVDGVILAAETSVISEIGQHHVVFVDRGTADGVQDGNVFTVLRSGDPYGKRIAEAAVADPRLPTEEVGSLLVVDAREHASTALVVRAARELVAGDRVELRVAAPAAGSGSN